MKQLPAIQRRRKGGINFVIIGRNDPSNSDNQNGDGGGLVCVHACVMCSIYDNNVLPRLIMIIIKIIFLYLIEKAHTDDFPSTGTRLVYHNYRCQVTQLVTYGLQVPDVIECLWPEVLQHLLSVGTAHLATRWRIVSIDTGHGSTG